MTSPDEDHVPRSLAPSIPEALSDTPVVCLLGPRQCGKSTLATRLDPERLLVSLDESRYLDTAPNDPDGFVRSLPRRVTIDEIQRAPRLLRAIKRFVDLDREPGRFLLTGSANLLLLSDVDESLAGRIEVERLQPLTESEKERQLGAFLQTLLRGGFETAIHAESGAGDEPTLARRLELLALRTGELRNVSVLANELKLGRATVERYLQLLERTVPDQAPSPVAVQPGEARDRAGRLDGE